ncbi:hypothetical protein CANMA_001659 [Candida margitis]|uniref:uncharacterized protein n=1 Tax=Candida margitis TaxID=1775924 RepID=UPI00222659E1|nr:uncharacterized protein CANMA_001659 [Candida margitis]KAI5969339.1 hypothetical protein CANMA_001659 [Candida margitis]
MMIRSRNTLPIRNAISSCHKHSTTQLSLSLGSSAGKWYGSEESNHILRLRNSPILARPSVINTKCSSKISTRSYSTLNHTKAPTKEFLGSFLDHEYKKANALIFDEELRNKFLTGLSDLAVDEIPRAKTDFYKIVEATFEFQDKGFEFIGLFWKALSLTENSALLDLQKEILGQREKLLSLILHTGRFDIFEKFILPSMEKFVPHHGYTFLDKVTMTLELQKTPIGLVEFNAQKLMSELTDEATPTSEKRDFVIALVVNSLAAGDNYESRMRAIESFVKYAKVVEDDEWLTVEGPSEYDTLYQMIGIPSSEDKFDYYFQDIIKIVEKYHGVSVSYDFLTHLMRTLSERAPFVTYRLFEFKSAQWRQRNLPRRDILNHLDLAYAMKACLKLDENKVYEIYLQNEDLHDDESQEAIFLDLCVQHKDWKSLQDRFENMYGKGNLPDTIHYGITMQALEFLEADSELERLYEQILDRKLIMNAAIFIARMKAKIRQKNQKDLIAIFENYVSLVTQEKARKDGVAQAFPYSLQLMLLDGAYELVLETLETHLQKEKTLELRIVSGEALGIVARHFSRNCAVKDLDRLAELARKFHKHDSVFTSSLIAAYTRLGQYSKADEIAYYAHSQSSPPFSDLQVYASQLKNYLLWRRGHISRKTKLYNDIKINYIVTLSLQTELSIFQSHTGGIDLLNAVMDCLRQDAIDYSQANSLRQLKGRPIKTINSLLKSQIAHRMRLDETLYLPLLKQNLVYQNYKPLNVMKLFNEMNQKRILVSAESYKYVMKAMRSLDKRYDRSYKNSTEMLKQMLQLYGFDGEKPKSNPRLDFKKDSVLICDILIKYVESVGLKKGSDLFSRFVMFCETSFDGKLPLDLRAKIDRFLAICYKRVNSTEYGMFLEQKFEVYRSMFLTCIQETGRDVCVAPILNETLADFTIQRMEYLIQVNEFGIDHQKEIIDVLEMGVQPNVFDYNYLLSYFLKQAPTVHFVNIMQIIEDYLIMGNLSQLELYKQKKLCYKICMVHLCDVYDEQAVAENFKILSDYFGIKSLDKDRAHLKELNYLRSSSGRLFNINLDPYGSRSMNQFNFIDYFNPARDVSNEPRLFNETSRLLMRVVSEYCNNIRQNEVSFAQQYPKIFAYINSDLSYYPNLSAFNGKVDYLNSSQDTRLRRTKDVLRELLFNHNKAKIFIPSTVSNLEDN